MKTIETPPATQEQKDEAEVLRLVSEGKRITDSELRRRISERSDAVRRRIRETHGVVEWAVDLIRDGREED